MPEPPDRPLIPHMRLDELLAELHARLETALTTRDRVHSLLEAVVSIGGDLDIATVLRRLTEAAAHLVNARYAGLGVVDEDGRFTEFIPVGVPEQQAQQVARFPHGKGILAVPSRERRALRLSELHDHPDFEGFPSGHPTMNSFLGVPVQVRDEVFGNLYLSDKADGGEFDQEDEAIVTALATAAGVAIKNARLYEETRLRERWLAASTEITTRLLSGVATSDVLGYLAQQAREMSGADVAVVLLPDDEDKHLIAELVDGSMAAEIRGTPVLIGETQCGDVYRSGEAASIADLRYANCPMLSHRGFRPGLLIPLGTPERTRGVLLLGKHGVCAPFDPTTRRMLNAFAGQAAVALELADARRDAERLVVLEDRDRIAKDLHDTVIQRLFASAMTLMSTIRLIPDAEAGDRVQRTIDDLDETIREIRSTVFALQNPPAPQDISLRGRFLAAIETATHALGCRPTLAFDGPVDAAVPDDIGEQMLAVLREALSNVARHAHADEVRLRVTVDTHVTLEVADNGVGIPEGGRRSGLRNMAERATALGGEFEARERQGGGTVLVWRVPLP
ncbi:sensor histidine kinase [Marinitenerispora sediminis]|uniref:Histidine kinase n=1 Tax=Marinitenerispora sediminis TaxID=1931232 RepID=A0A368T1P9_9ACTN|nr:GAF domain-containing protein [Marinitenerispora sediminis]RCV54012.1 histidine kinase [Marinitenerispora sediminis]RCV57788.1 histidine kinase [Marinitenerispora sediminis]RCV59533.1 histidine kinase [Marinitenerispora sediminis]